MKFKNMSLSFLGFLQATGLFTYILLVASLLANANRLFAPNGSLLGPIAFLLLFVVSAMISGLLVLAKAGYLFWEKRYKESFTLLAFTIAWATFYLVSVFIFLFISK